MGIHALVIHLYTESVPPMFFFLNNALHSVLTDNKMCILYFIKMKLYVTSYSWIMDFESDGCRLLSEGVYVRTSPSLQSIFSRNNCKPVHETYILKCRVKHLYFYQWWYHFWCVCVGVGVDGGVVYINKDDVLDHSRWFIYVSIVECPASCVLPLRPNPSFCAVVCFALNCCPLCCFVLPEY